MRAEGGRLPGLTPVLAVKTASQQWMMQDCTRPTSFLRREILRRAHSIAVKSRSHSHQDILRTLRTWLRLILRTSTSTYGRSLTPLSSEILQSLDGLIVGLYFGRVLSPTSVMVLMKRAILGR